MSNSEAALILEARRLLAEKQDLDKRIAKAAKRNGTREREALWQKRREVVARLNEMPDWALGEADALTLARQFVANKFCRDEDEARLIRWAEARQGF